MPASYALGLTADANERLRLLASVGLMRWSSFDQTVFVFDNPAQPAEVITSDWKDTWSVSVGAEYEIGEATTLRGGFMFDETPVNDAFAAPRIPDADRYWIALGATHAFSPCLEIDVAAAVVLSDERPVRLDGALPENFLRGSLDADFQTHTYVISGRARWRF
jgi:long-chain fatty acid transport protein